MVLYIFLLIIGLILFAKIYLNKFDKVNEKDIKEIYRKNKYYGMMSRYDVNKDTTTYKKIYKKAVFETLAARLSSLLGKIVIEKININVDFQSWEKIKKRRLDAMGTNLYASGKDYVPVTVQHKGKTVKAEMRLKGDQGDHRDDPKKWSFRINVKKGKTLFHMRNFSIQHPKVRGYQYEAVLSYACTLFDVLRLRYFFIDVSINGESIGIMALEEHFSKELLESQGRKEGVIFKFYENDFWKAVLKFGWVGKDETIPTSMYLNGLNVPIRAYKSKKIAKSKALSKQKEIGIGLIRSVMQGRLKASEVFDIDKTAAYLALLTFFEANHTIMSINLRFYLNPITLKLEPIVFDFNGQIKLALASATVSRNLEIVSLMLQDNKIYNRFKEYIFQLNSEMLNIEENSFLLQIQKKEREYLKILRQEFFALPEMYFKGMKNYLQKNINKIMTDRYFLKPELRERTMSKAAKYKDNVKLPAIVYAYILKEDNSSYLEFSNILSEKIIIKSLNIKINGIEKKTSEILTKSLPISLPPTFTIKAPNLVRMGLSNIKLDDKVEISGIASPVSQHINYEFQALHYFPTLEKHPIASESLEKLLNENVFLQLSVDTENELVIKKGKWEIKDMIIFPEGMSIKIESGTILKFRKDAGFIIYGNLYCKGKKKNPIILESITSSKDDSWKGIAVINANYYSSGQKSLLKNVIIKNTNFPRYNGWEITGAVTFYKSDVDLQNVTFDRTIAEDALNIANSKFNMDSVEIKKSKSDAFDSDFSEGLIKDCLFKDIGGDAVDFSGSDVKVKDCKFTNIHDKAISAGEGTVLNVENVHADKVGTGVASKDGSTTYLKNGIFENVEHSVLMAYMKKPEYGGGKIIAGDITFQDSKNAIVAQKRSRIILDSKRIKTQKVNIDKLYKEGYMRK
ncbi:right-handed parallel beta-helix repeat-containing protein [bacterium]